MAYNKDNASTGLRGTTTNPQYGRDTLGNSDNRSGLGKVSSSGMRDKSDMGTTTETYGGIGRETHHDTTGASTASSIPESSPLNPTTGRGTTTGAYESSRFGTGANTGVIDPDLSTTASSSTSSGAGIHARQYHGREGEYGGATVSSGATPGVGHHVSHHHHHGHGHVGNTSTSQTVVENENVQRLPGTTAAGVGMGTTYGTTGMAGVQSTTGTTGVGQEQRFSEQGTVPHGKPSMMDKIIGGTEKGFGKITSNPAMVQQGAERAAGEFERSSKN